MAPLLTALAALVVALVALVLAARGAKAPPVAAGGKPMKLAATGLHYGAGTSGTYTVPAGAYATGLTCYSAAGGTLVITPVGQGAGPSITIPAGVPFSMAEPLLGTANQLNAGSTLAFTGTDSYVVVLG